MFPRKVLDQIFAILESGTFLTETSKNQRPGERSEPSRHRTWPVQEPRDPRYCSQVIDPARCPRLRAAARQAACRHAVIDLYLERRGIVCTVSTPPAMTQFLHIPQ